MTGASSSVPSPVLDSNNANSVPGSLLGSSVFGVGLEKSFAWYLSSEKYSASTKFAPKRLPFSAFLAFDDPSIVANSMKAYPRPMISPSAPTAPPPPLSSPAPGSLSNGGALDPAPAGTSANDRSVGVGVGNGFGADPTVAKVPSEGFVSSSAMTPPAPPLVWPAVRAFAGAPSTRPPAPPCRGLGISMETTGPNFSASKRMSAQISW
mmetsp:Transcript_51656/g.102685  ORF Transcript_51656/g.102685 Transcript_51656/m.102685 type:complete len:208 (+) Transcript_51656:395-1018(+)